MTGLAGRSPLCDRLTDPWQAEWIWLQTPSGGDYAYAIARKSFELTGTVTEARLRISASNIYRLIVNGQAVGRGPDRSDPRFPYFDGYDVADLLVSGTNVIAVDVYAITTTGDRGRMWCLYGGEAGLLLELSGETVDGPFCQVTDASWRMIQSSAWHSGAARISRFLGYVEHVDGRHYQALTDCHAAAFDDSGWPNCVSLGKPPDGPLGEPLAREAPGLEPRRRLPLQVGSRSSHDRALSSDVRLLGFHPEQPLTIAATGDEAVDLTLDFGRSMGGFFHLELRQCSGGTVEIFYGEDTHQVLCERLDLPPRGELVFTSFDWRGARHMTLRFSGLGRDIEIGDLAFIEYTYPFQDRGAFDADEARLGEIWRRCRTTARIGVKDHPVDCVHREQALWVSDLLPHLRTVLACFGDVRPFVKACRQVVRTINADGIMPVPGPCGQGYHYDADTLPWSEQPLNVALIITEIYRYTGDTEWVAELVPGLHRVMRHISRYRDGRGVLRVDPPGLRALSPFCGWGTSLKATGIPTIVNAEYVMSLEAMSQLAAVAGQPDHTESYAKAARQTADSVVSLFYDSEAHLFIDGEVDGQPHATYSPSVNAYAVVAGLLPASEAGAWARAMETDARLGELGSPFDAGTLLEGFLKVGAEDPARRLLDACWGHFLDLDEPCIPERWLAGHQTMLTYGRSGPSSRAHAYGTAPAYCLSQFVLGIHIVEPGCGRIRIAPVALGLELARGRRPLPQGDVEIFWRRNRDEWYLEVVLPAGVTAEVELPRPSLAAGTFEVDGTTIWETTGWQRHREAALRHPSSEVETHGRCTLDTHGRHICRTTTKPTATAT